MKMKNMAAMCGVMMLAACSGGPSDPDLQEALKVQIDQLRANAFTAPMADAMQASIQKLHLANCKSADAGGYQCDMVDGNGNAKSIRMIKVDGKWSIVA
jgi:hypothetical protein